jgi:hypothetical protein
MHVQIVVCTYSRIPVKNNSLDIDTPTMTHRYIFQRGLTEIKEKEDSLGVHSPQMDVVATDDFVGQPMLKRNGTV